MMETSIGPGMVLSMSDTDDESGSVVPSKPTTISEVGISINNLIKLAIKLIYIRAIETAPELVDAIKLPISIAQELFDEAKQRQLVHILGSVDKGAYSNFRYELTSIGKSWAVDALAQNQYVGPAPVALDNYRTQIMRQSLTNERVGREELVERFAGLLVPDTLERRLGPAINSGRSVLLYGAPGNGKTSIAQAVAGVFGGEVYIPYSLEVGGEIIRIFDPTLHQQSVGNDAGDDAGQGGEKADVTGADQRWVSCRRPVVSTGGELTLDMLGLGYSAISNFYDAPLHMKAVGGVFIIDDLGRQLIRPEDLLNRWTIPMEKRIDYLTLQSGMSFWIPFDALLIFSTNLEPSDLMNPAFLRRIPYKVEMKAPTDSEFRTLFSDLCDQYELSANDEFTSFVVREIQTTHRQPLSFYQPKFIVEQVVAASRYKGCEPELSIEALSEALENISAITSERRSAK